MQDHSKLASSIIDLIGGSKNITAAWHCVTRLRFNVVDAKKVRSDDIKKLKGTVSAQFSGEQFQVIIGNEVTNVFTEVEKQLGTLTQSDGQDSGEKKGIVSSLMDTISAIFTPALPALVGTGLLKGFLALFTGLGWMSEASSAFLLLDMIGDCVFYFLPFFLAITSARKYKVNEFVALAIAAVMMYPTMTDGAALMMAGLDTPEFSILGLPVLFLPYSSSVIPIILAVYLLKHVINLVKKFVPKAISLMFVPMISLIIIVPITLLVLGPLGIYVGGALSFVLSWLFDTLGVVAGALVGAFYPLMVMTGMHYGVGPLMINNFAELGYDSNLAPAMLASTFAIAGSTFGVFFKTRNSEIKQISLSSGISAVIGITEPAMFGVSLRLKKPFYAAMIGGGVAGAFMSLFNIKQYAMAMPGLIAMAGFVDPVDNMNIVWAIIGAVLAFGLSCAAAMFLGFDDEEEEATLIKENQTYLEEMILNAPISGKVVPVETVSDATFAEQIMGYTAAILPTDNKVFSPVSGEILLISETKHAVGIKADNGAEILLHLGIDTVELKGNGFNTKVATGDRIEAGELLIEMDLEIIKEAGFDTTVMCIVTNSTDFVKILPVNQNEEIKAGERISVIIT